MPAGSIRPCGILRSPQDIVTPYAAEEVIAWPISTLVDNVKNDGPEQIELLES
jgi:putative SOS response-associated peptidase YedK